jgi:phosphoglycerate dehydrogenase-like enzyme
MPLSVVVTEPEFVRPGAMFAARPDIDWHVAPPDEASVVRVIEARGARHAIIGPRPYRQRLYDVLPRGGVLARFGVGYDGVDVPRATAAGILCTNTPGAMDQSVAELAVMFMAAAARHLVTLHGTMASGQWAPRGGVELAGRTVAIIGTGRIGSATARIAKALGMQVIGCRRPNTEADMSTEGTPFDLITNRYEEAVRDADFVVLLIPGRAENRHYINRDRLDRMAAHAWLINVARGSVVDERALYDCLAAGRIAGAAIDVYEREPYEPAEPGRDLRTLGNVMLVPHIGSNTVESNRRMSERAIRNVELGAAGQYDAMDLVNPDVLLR